jgi:hypothetical protein
MNKSVSQLQQGSACAKPQPNQSHDAAGMPNHSVNLTRNSVPRWPSEARYAHTAPLVQQVTLSHSG